MATPRQSDLPRFIIAETDMQLALPLVIDALRDCGLVVAENPRLDKPVFSRMEIYIDQPVEDGVLYLADGAMPQDCGDAAFLIASADTVPEGAVACTANTTAAETMNALNKFMARLSACVEGIEESCRDGGDPHALCQTIADFVGNPIVIYDDTMTPIAQTDFPREFAMRLFGSEAIDADFVFRAVPEWEVMEPIDISTYTGAYRTINVRSNDLRTVMCGIMYEGCAQGFLEIFEARKSITDDDMLVLEYASRAASHLLPFRNTSFIESSLAGKPLQGPRASVWLNALRWHVDDELFVAAIDLSESYDDNRYARKVVERTLRSALPNSDYTTIDGTSIVVANSRFVTRIEAVEKLMALFPSVNGLAFLGMSDLVAGVSELHIGYEHARFAARHARRISPSATALVTFEQCRFAYLASLCDLEQNADFIRDGRVKRRYDNDLVSGAGNTLAVKAYIETGFNLNATAERLIVHRNTVAYRLKQVAERYGIDLSSPVRDPDLIFQVLISCKLLLGDS